MRINRYIALSTGLSRRAADLTIEAGRVTVNGLAPLAGQQIGPSDAVTLDSTTITPPINTVTILLNKPVGYVCSRDGQGSKTVYDLLPTELHNLKPVGRLDKDSSGLLLMTNEGKLAHELSHPSFQKEKVYDVTLDKQLKPVDKAKIETGVLLEDGMSKLQLKRMVVAKDISYEVRMHEGRNRQIRRTFEKLNYKVTKLLRTQFGTYKLGSIQSGKYKLS
ncbi:MAG TPA: pseudouridine synthase [Patescibacteria group bacterium]|nr:pseudouridine synthase [Patescibacteria group bacterium]